VNVAAWQPISLLDYPDRVATTVFTPGCTFRCPFCHNPELVLPDRVAGLCLLDQAEVLGHLADRAGFVDAVVITGGEPTLQPDLGSFLERVREIGVLIKLDTNGTRPDVLERLLADGLLDYVAMDVKAPRERYDEFCGTAADLTSIDQSMGIVRRRAPAYELRTTVAPGMTVEDVRGLAAWIEGAAAYYLQAFRAPSGKGLIDLDWQPRIALNTAALRDLWSEIAPRFSAGGIRG